MNVNTQPSKFNSSLQSKKKKKKESQATLRSPGLQGQICNEFMAAARRTENLHKTVSARASENMTVERDNVDSLDLWFVLNKRPPVQAIPKAYFSHSTPINP